MMQQIALVQCYIHHVKGVEVKINPPSNMRQIMLLNRAYEVANEYFK